MQAILRRHLLTLMLGVTAATFTAPFLFDAPAFAKDGRGGDSSGSGSGDSDSDSGGSSSSSGGNSGSSGDSGGDDSGNDGGSGDDDGTPDQGSGNDDDGDDDSNDDSNDDRNDDSKAAKKAEKAAKKAARNAARPTVTITLTDDSLANVQNGTHVVVDQLGRQLEITVRTVNGQKVISAKPHGGAAKRNPGPITNIDVVPVTSVPGNDDGTPDQGSGDN